MEMKQIKNNFLCMEAIKLIKHLGGQLSYQGTEANVSGRGVMSSALSQMICISAERRD